MSKKPARSTATPAHHGPECECAVCERKRRAATGGGRAPDALPRLSDDGLSRFKLHDSAREAGGGFGFVSLNDRFCDYLDRRRERAWDAWATLLEREPEAALCLRLCVADGLSQRLCAAHTGLSPATVNRRVRGAKEFLLAAVGDVLATELRGLVKHPSAGAGAAGA